VETGTTIEEKDHKQQNQAIFQERNWQSNSAWFCGWRGIHVYCMATVSRDDRWGGHAVRSGFNREHWPLLHRCDPKSPGREKSWHANQFARL
jgi:hypothetical protein